MKFLKDNQKTRSVIVDFFKEKKRTVKNIVFQKDAAVVTTKDDEMTDIFESYLASPSGSPKAKRMVSYMYIFSCQSGYAPFDQMFMVNDFECYSLLDLTPEQACNFTTDWLKTMYSNLKEGADDYLCEAEDYFCKNSEEK